MSDRRKKKRSLLSTPPLSEGAEESQHNKESYQISSEVPFLSFPTPGSPSVPPSATTTFLVDPSEQEYHGEEGERLVRSPSIASTRRRSFGCRESSPLGRGETNYPKSDAEESDILNSSLEIEDSLQTIRRTCTEVNLRILRPMNESVNGASAVADTENPNVLVAVAAKEIEIADLKNQMANALSAKDDEINALKQQMETERAVADELALADASQSVKSAGLLESQRLLEAQVTQYRELLAVRDAEAIKLKDESDAAQAAKNWEMESALAARTQEMDQVKREVEVTLATRADEIKVLQQELDSVIITRDQAEKAMKEKNDEMDQLKQRLEIERTAADELALADASQSMRTAQIIEAQRMLDARNSELKEKLAERDEEVLLLRQDSSVELGSRDAELRQLQLQSDAALLARDRDMEMAVAVRDAEIALLKEQMEAERVVADEKFGTLEAQRSSEARNAEAQADEIKQVREEAEAALVEKDRQMKAALEAVDADFTQLKAELMTAVRTKDEAIAQLKKEMNDALEATQRTLDTRTQEIAALKERLESVEATRDRMGTTLAQKEKEIDDLNVQMGLERAAADELAVADASQSTWAAGLIDAQQMLKAKNAELTEIVASRDADLNSLTQEMNALTKSKTQDIEGMKSVLSDRDAEIALLRQQVDAALQTKENIIAEHKVQDAAADVAKSLAVREAELVARRTQTEIASRDQEIIRLKVQLENHEQLLGERTSEIAQLKQQMELEQAAADELAMADASLSSKTAGLRTKIEALATQNYEIDSLKKQHDTAMGAEAAQKAALQAQITSLKELLIAREESLVSALSQRDNALYGREEALRQVEALRRDLNDTPSVSELINEYHATQKQNQSVPLSACDRPLVRAPKTQTDPTPPDPCDVLTHRKADCVWCDGRLTLSMGSSLVVVQRKGKEKEQDRFRSMLTRTPRKAQPGPTSCSSRYRRTTSSSPLLDKKSYFTPFCVHK